MAPSQLQIATSSLQRLLKEEASYYKEQEQQEARISKLVGESSNGDTDDHDDGNREYVLKQERQALEETKRMMPTLRERITNAREKLESLLDTAPDDEERNKAVEVIKSAKEAQKDDPVAGQSGS